MVQIALTAKVIAKSETGVMAAMETMPAKNSVRIATLVSTTRRKRRGSKISARAPASSVNRNIGRLVATCTMDTAAGSALRLVISQPEAVSDIAMQISPAVLAAQITEKFGERNALHHGGGGSFAESVTIAPSSEPIAWVSRSVECPVMPPPTCKTLAPGTLRRI